MRQKSRGRAHAGVCARSSDRNVAPAEWTFTDHSYIPQFPTAETKLPHTQERLTLLSTFSSLRRSNQKTRLSLDLGRVGASSRANRCNRWFTLPRPLIRTGSSNNSIPTSTASAISKRSPARPQGAELLSLFWDGPPAYWHATSPRTREVLSRILCLCKDRSKITELKWRAPGHKFGAHGWNANISFRGCSAVRAGILRP